MPCLDEINIQIEEVEELNIYSVKGKGGVEDFGSLMENLYTNIVERKLTPTSPPMTFYHRLDINPEDFYIEVAIAIEEVVSESRKLPRYKLATIMYKGLYENIPSAYSDLANWVKENNYNIVDSPYEIYMTDPNTTLAEENLVKVCFPIELI